MSSMNEKDYYAILGVAKEATGDEIRKAFQQKARKLHPDVNKEPDAEARFKEVSEAYAVLSDDNKRRRYDAMRSGSPFAGASYGAPAGSYPDSYGNPFSWGFPFSGFDGAFRRQASSAQRSRSYNPKAGADIIFQIDIDENQAAQGVHRGITYQRYSTCNACHGSGSVHTEHPETCPTCNGSGRISLNLSDFIGFGVMEMVCPECQGTGQVVADPCSVCGGAGRVLTASEVVVDIPAGSHDGDTVRVPGKGNAGTNGETAGDFVCRIGVPAEQPDGRATMGFRSLGLFIPFLLLYALSNQQTMLIGLVIALALFLFVVISSGGFTHSKYWWRNAWRILVRAASSVLPIVFFFLIIRVFTTFVLACSTLGRY
ncbi:DnaJ central domain protein [Coriobacteriaceae bacterium BV3Ac1]|uniref:DnaJ domain-containing protein n=1 Tax=Olegusella massiliensis TaxID=1776381 RepID=UPI0003AE3B52|nr:DnaJ domain-containing protein [Olegusella massiliensis]ERL11910.1 DnaJ central domain protein [Coriobacteriaceae bacterium BV3Ac1]